MGSSLHYYTALSPLWLWLSARCHVSAAIHSVSVRATEDGGWLRQRSACPHACPIAHPASRLTGSPEQLQSEEERKRRRRGRGGGGCLCVCLLGVWKKGVSVTGHTGPKVQHLLPFMACAVTREEAAGIQEMSVMGAGKHQLVSGTVSFGGCGPQMRQP
ncbi:unnamed protein product [Pleuronectes platessa]|uniref:Secreted protein n=1 Tax=Pleuronectes platessa TaxID=8262 RepID=A0A9N7VGQ9_PLEPL|nr:unnamed protein product [Pleuronectes platessa]